MGITGIQLLLTCVYLETYEPDAKEKVSYIVYQLVF